MNATTARVGYTPRLLEPEDWFDWIAYIKRFAGRLGIRDLLDAEGEQKLLTAPGTDPPVSDTTAYLVWQSQRKDYQEQQQAISAVLTKIYESVDKHVLRGSEDDDLRTMINRLQKHYSTDSKAFLDRMQNLYDSLVKGQATTKNGSEEWCNKWLDLESMARRDSTNSFPERKLLRGFIEGSQKASASFYHTMIVRCYDDNDNTTLEQAIRLYKAVIPVNYGKPSIVEPVALATDAKQSKRKERLCLCGLKHRWPDCYIINPSKAPSYFKPSDARKKAVEEAMKDPRTRATVERVIKRESTSGASNSQKEKES